MAEVDDIGRRRWARILSPARSRLRVPSGATPSQGAGGDAEFEQRAGIVRSDPVAEQLGLNPKPVYRPPGWRR